MIEFIEKNIDTCSFRDRVLFYVEIVTYTKEKEEEKKIDGEKELPLVTSSLPATRCSSSSSSSFFFLLYICVSLGFFFTIIHLVYSNSIVQLCIWLRLSLINSRRQFLLIYICVRVC